MRNTHGFRILEETKDYILHYNQYGEMTCWNKLEYTQSVMLVDKETEDMYFEERVFDAKTLPKTGKEEEKYLRKSVKNLLKRYKNDKKVNYFIDIDGEEYNLGNLNLSTYEFLFQTDYDYETQHIKGENVITGWDIYF